MEVFDKFRSKTCDPYVLDVISIRMELFDECDGWLRLCIFSSYDGQQLGCPCDVMPCYSYLQVVEFPMLVKWFVIKIIISAVFLKFLGSEMQ